MTVTIALLVAVAAGIAIAQPLSAQSTPPCDVSWLVASSGDWHDGVHWSGGQAPTPGQHACITVDGSYTVTLSADASVGRLTVGPATGVGNQNLSLDGAAPVTLTVTNGPLTNAGTMSISASFGPAARVVAAELHNRSAFNVFTPLTLGRAGANHRNSGTLTVWQVTLTLGGGAGQTFTQEAGTTSPGFSGDMLATGQSLILRGGTYSLPVSGAAISFPPGSAVGGGFEVHGVTTLSGVIPENVDLTIRNTTTSAPSGLTNRGDITLSGLNELPAEFSVAGGLTNSGTITMQAISGSFAAAQTLIVTGAPLVNLGQIAIQAGGPRTINATLHNQPGATVQFGGATILGFAGAVHRNLGNLQLHSPVTLPGGSGGFHQEGGGLSFSGILNAQGYAVSLRGGSVHNAKIVGAAVTYPAGSAVTGSFFPRAVTTITGILPAGAGLTIENATTSAPNGLTANGDILIESVSGQPAGLSVSGGPFTNNGQIILRNTNTNVDLTISVSGGAFVNNRQVLMQHGGSFVIDADIYNQRTFTRAATGNLLFAEIFGDTFTYSKNGGRFVNAGSVQIGTLTLASGTTYTNLTGAQTGSNAVPRTLTVQQGATLVAGGVVDMDIENAGLVKLGSPVGTTRFRDYLSTATGTLEVEIGGPMVTTDGDGDFDWMQVQAANLAGTLNVVLVNGYRPPIGANFEIIRSGGITGAFATVNGLSLGSGLAFQLQLTPERAALHTVAAPGPLATGSATLTGTVTLQGRSASFPTGAGHGIATVQVAGQSGQVAVSGAFSISGVPDGRHTLRACAPGYLCAERQITVSGGVVSGSLPPVELAAGLVDGDDAVTVNDVTAVIAAFGLQTPNRLDGLGRIVDLNGDGVVNLRDLTLVLGNFGKTSPRAWP